MTQCYIPPEIIKAHKLFPNSGYLRFKWLENQRYLKKRNLGNKGGWLVDGGFRCLCKPCHKIKTAEERKSRGSNVK